MKIKTINSVICKKFDEWIETITDETVKALVEKNTICTGGCIASMLLKEQVNDFDFYFRTKETVLAVAWYYVQQFKRSNPTQTRPGPDKELPFTVIEEGDRVIIKIQSSGVASEENDKKYQFFEGADPYGTDTREYVDAAMKVAEDCEDDSKPKYRPVFLSTNAITLSQKIQLVIRFYGDPANIHENYDFLHCTNYWTSWDRKVVTNSGALEALLAKELRYVGSKYPLCSVVRMRKFIARGWTVNAGQILKMCMQLNALDMGDLSVLQDQLTGMDVAYFMQVINELKKKDSANVDQAYLIEIIDRMF